MSALFTYRLILLLVGPVLPVDQVEAGVGAGGVLVLDVPPLPALLVSTSAVYVNTNPLPQPGDVFVPDYIILYVGED